MSDNMSYLYTVGGYATLFGIGYIIYQVSTQKERARLAAGPAKVIKSSQTEPRKDDRKKKQRKETFATEAQESKKTAPKAPITESIPSYVSKVVDDQVDNREFARQLAKAKEGAKFSTSSDGGKQREKSVKQSRASKINAVEEKTSTLPVPSAPSSTTGADADDDQSPITSPEVGPATAGDVSDMLEPTSSRPTVIRLTDTAPKQQNKKAAKVAAPVESKKQRQNRKKAEAAKVAREENEKERKTLEEKQRRTARIAEGRAAKDGSQYTAAAAAANSKWNQGAPNNKTSEPAQSNGLHQPLDTFEATPSTRQSVPSVAVNNTSLPSEEEQIAQLQADDDDWSTVKTKSSKKTVKNASSVDSGDEPVQSRPAVQPKQISSNTRESKPSQSFGSFSALSSKDDPAEEEVEEEWDV